MFRNNEGYYDPSAGGAIAKVSHERKRMGRLDYMQAVEDYEQLCRELRKLAASKGFLFSDRIWLKHEKSGKMFRNG